MEMRRDFILRCVLLMFLAFPLNAATQSDVKVLDAVVSIRYRISDLTVTYMLSYLYPKKYRLKFRLQEDLQGLTKALQVISETVKDEKSKNLLAYFTYQRARIDTMFKKKATLSYLRELLTMSESFVEGVDFIAHRHAYQYSFEEKMYMNTRMMTYDLEEILKYYIAKKILSDKDLDKKLHQKTVAFEKDLEAVNEYQYDDQLLLQDRTRLNEIWKLIKSYLPEEESNPLPLVMTVSAHRIESFLKEFGTYHIRNQ